jgi:hypothetical protein
MSLWSEQAAARGTIMQVLRSASAGYASISAHAMEFPMPLFSGHYKADELKTSLCFQTFHCDVRHSSANPQEQEAIFYSGVPVDPTVHSPE